jgi:hypothetical protein
MSMADKLKNATINIAPTATLGETVSNEVVSEVMNEIEEEKTDKLTDDRSVLEAKQDDNTEDDDLYNIKNFVI